LRQNSTPTTEFLGTISSIISQLPGLDFRVLRAIILNALKPDIRDHVRAFPQNLLNWNNMRTAIQQFSPTPMIGQMPHEQNSQESTNNAEFTDVYRNKRLKTGKNSYVPQNRQVNFNKLYNNKNNHKRCEIHKTSTHDLKECNILRKYANSERNEANFTNGESLTFTIDSGCTQHMVPSYITLQNEQEHQETINTASKTSLRAIAVGNLTGKINERTLTLSNVLRIEGLQKPLLSVAGCTKDKIGVSFTENGDVHFLTNNQHIFSGNRSGKTYTITMKLNESAYYTDNQDIN
jgi:hypothetical protein